VGRDEIRRVRPCRHPVLDCRALVCEVVPAVSHTMSGTGRGSRGSRRSGDPHHAPRGRARRPAEARPVRWGHDANPHAVRPSLACGFTSRPHRTRASGAAGPCIRGIRGIRVSSN
jgi:hypothetical protein